MESKTCNMHNICRWQISANHVMAVASTVVPRPVNAVLNTTYCSTGTSAACRSFTDRLNAEVTIVVVQCVLRCGVFINNEPLTFAYKERKTEIKCYTFGVLYCYKL